MKKQLTFILMALLISLLAVGAFAQTQEEPVKEQVRQSGSEENSANPGTANANQNYTDYENQKPAAPHDPTGPAGADAQGETNQGVQTVDTEKTGDQTQTGNYGDSDGNNYELGDNNRNGDEFTGVGGPHGPGEVSPDTEKSGDQTQTGNYGEGDGNNHELGNNNRNGDEFTGVGGPHGPGEVAPDNMMKLMGLDDMVKGSGDGSFDGSLLEHTWGPGERDAGGHFGPNDGVGFGPAGSDVAKEGSETVEARGQARAGRR